MAYIALSRSIRIESDGPHFQYYSADLATTINVSIPKGVYYTAVPNITDAIPSIEDNGTIAYQLNQALSAYNVSISTYSYGDTPAWYYNNKLQISLPNQDDELTILNTPDARRLAWALGWVSVTGQPLYSVKLEDEYILHPVMGYMLLRGGVMYKHDLAGFRQYNEDIIIAQDGSAVAIASDEYNALYLQITDIERDRLLDMGMESTQLNAGNGQKWYVRYDYTMNPFVFNSGGGYLWVYNDAKDEWRRFTYKGFANKIQTEDVQTVVDNWLQLYNLNLVLTGVTEV